MIVIVRSPKTGARITFSEYMESLYEQMESGTKEKLKERKEKYSEIGVDIEIYITIGKPTDKIVEYSDKIKADIVVIGSTGVSGISKFFKGLGSVSRNVSESIMSCIHCKIKVLVNHIKNEMVWL